MKKSIKARTPILALIPFVFTFGQAFAADKVVVVPLGGGDVTGAQFNEQHVWSGYVGQDGTKLSTGAYTSTQFGTGSYSVTLNLDGFDIDYWPSRFPIAVISVSNGGSGFVPGWGSSNADGKFTFMSLTVDTYNSAGSLADSGFTFHIKFTDPDPAAPVVGLSSAESSIPEWMRCETVGEVTNCTIGEIE